MVRGSLIFWLACLSGIAVAGEVIVAGPDDYRGHLPRLQPGDTLQLLPGVYRDGLPLRNLRGEPGRGIVIEGPAGGAPAVFEARDKHITVSLIDVAHVTIRHLHLRGKGRRAHAVVAEGRGSFAHDVTLEDLDIAGFDAAQSYVGISTKAPAWNWIIRNNRISRVGTGMYLGNSNGAAPFVAGLIEGNRVEQTLGYNLQIKHQQIRPGLAGLPQGQSVTIIRDNVFSKLDGASTGPAARPNVLVGHWPVEGPGHADRYLIHGNLFFQNPGERLLQAEGNVAVYNNLFVNSFGGAMSIQPHNDVPKDVHVLFNTVLSRGAPLRLHGAAAGHAQAVDGNAFFSDEPPSLMPGLKAGDNRLRPLAAAETELAAPFAATVDEVDLHPRADALRAASPWSGLPDFPGLGQDFDGEPRRIPHYGAHVRAGDPVRR
jgi:hypothetical protein